MSRAFRVGIFVVLALAALGAGVFLIGNKNFLFSRTYNLEAEFANVDGLDNGADVRVGGIHEGTVKQIILPSQSNQKITVVMTLQDSTKKDVKKDSVASIKTQGLVGDEYIDISFGSPKSPDVQNGDMIASEAPKDLSKEANALAGDAQQGITAFREDMQALQHNFLLRGYFNSRGYSNPAELTEHAIPRLPSEPKAKEFDFDAAKLFGKSDDAKLKNKGALKSAGRYLQGNDFGLAVVTSSEVEGGSNEDRILSEARAKVVRDYLVDNFRLDDKRLKTMGIGKIENAGPKAKSQISILVYPGKAPVRSARGISQSSSPQATRQ